METESVEQLAEKTYFDQMRVVRAFESDIAEHGEVQGGTWQRQVNEEATFIAEALDAPHISLYRYDFDGQGIMNVDGQRLRDMLTNGLEAAHNDYRQDKRCEFEYERAVVDASRHQTILDLMRGDEESPDAFFVISAFPEEASREHGASFVTGRGYQPERKLSFVRMYHRESDSTLLESTATLDGGSLQMFNDLLAEYGQSPSRHTSELLDTVVNVRLEDSDLPAFQRELIAQFDALKQRDGVSEFKQGRQVGSKAQIDSWGFVGENIDLVHQQVSLFADIADVRSGNAMSPALVSFLEASLRVGGLPNILKGPMEQAVLSSASLYGTETVTHIRRAITYMYASTMRRRYEKAMSRNGLRAVSGSDSTAVYDEVMSSAELAIRNLEQVIGCGGVHDMFEQATLEELRAMALNSPEAYTYDKIAHCVVCDPEASRPPVACGPCDICWRCETSTTMIKGGVRAA